jgi:octaprenyl-diphosphate synthase
MSIGARGAQAEEAMANGAHGLAYDLVGDDLVAVEARLRSLADSEVGLLADACRHAVDGRGKRVRPALLALSARAVAGDGYTRDESLVLLGAAVETVHLASLLHDDVVDGADIRRGRSTAHVLWGSKIAIFTADFLFSSVFTLLATPENTPLLRHIARAVMDMCEAEVLQAETAGSAETTEGQYRGIIDGKTAALMSAACNVGAELGGADWATAQRLATFGRLYGAAFQITDDLLDLVGTSTETGKGRGSDLRGGQCTLPFILLRDRSSEAERRRLTELLERGAELSDDEVDEIAQKAHRAGAVDLCRSAAQDCVEEAVNQLADLPGAAAREALAALARSVVDRRA